MSRFHSSFRRPRLSRQSSRKAVAALASLGIFLCPVIAMAEIDNPTDGDKYVYTVANIGVTGSNITAGGMSIAIRVVRTIELNGQEVDWVIGEAAGYSVGANYAINVPSMGDNWGIGPATVKELVLGVETDSVQIEFVAIPPGGGGGGGGGNQ